MWPLNLKNTLLFIRKKPHDRILREKPKEQYLSTIHKSCSLFLYHTTSFWSYLHLQLRALILVVLKNYITIFSTTKYQNVATLVVPKPYYFFSLYFIFLYFSYLLCFSSFCLIFHLCFFSLCVVLCFISPLCFASHLTDPQTHLPKPIPPRPHLPIHISLRPISLSPIDDLLPKTHHRRFCAGFVFVC